MFHGPQDIQLTLILVYHIWIYNKHTMAPPKELPPPIVFFHPVIDPVFVAKLIYNIKTIHIVVVIIIDAQN